MALLQINFYSEALRKITTFNMFLPNDVQEFMTEGNENYNRGQKTLFLLHGFSGNNIDWMLGSLAQDISTKYNMAIVMPSGDNSFYLDGKGTGRAYGKFIGEELVDYVRKTFNLGKSSEDTYIGGLSMGGFGAIRTGVKYPQTFGKIVGLSSALIIHDIKSMAPGSKNDIADYDYYTSVFGDLDSLVNSENNPEFLLKKLKENAMKIPKIFIACGAEDFLIQQNRDFIEFLNKEKIDVEYCENEGIHDWDYWNKMLEPSVKWLLNKN